MHPARQIRFGFSMLLLVVAAVAASSTYVAGQGTAAPFGGRRARAPQPPPKKQTEKTPELTARTEWTHDLPAVPAAQPAYDDERAYLPLESGEVASVSLTDGSVGWKTALLPTGRVAAGGGLVFVPVAGAIEARDAATGAARWRVPIEGRLSAPLVWQNGWLLAATDKGAAVMLRAATGQLLWKQALGVPIRTRAAMTGDRIYVGLENGEVRALRLETGERIWSRALKGRPITLAPLDDRVFAGADDKFLYCLSAKNGKQDWRWRTGGAIIGIPVFDKDNVYFLSLDNVLRALDRGNGHQVWHTGLTFRPTAGPFLVGARLIVSGLVDVHAFRVSDGSEAGGFEAGGVLAAPPHFLPPDEDEVEPFLLFTREGQVAKWVPSAPVLASKPFPAKMIYPLWPLSEDGKSETAAEREKGF